jgi:hypothetical protein
MKSAANQNVDSLSRKVVRLIGLTIAVQVLALCFAVRASYTKTNEILMSLGAEMLRYPDALHQDRPRRIQLNGWPLHFSSGSTQQPVDRVLDYVHAKCREKNGNLADQLDKLIKKGRKAFDRNRYPLTDGVLRYGNEKQGFVACLATGGESFSPEVIVRRIRRFLETGELRYVMAERHQKTTSFVAFWTEGTANLLTVLPQDSDTPGHDLPGIPRPSDSRRVLSAWESGQSQAIAVYIKPRASLSNLIKTYSKQLSQEGWRILSWKPTNIPSDHAAFVAEKAGITAHFEFSRDDRDGSVVTIAKMN